MPPRKKTQAPRCIVIAGPNGAGKTTLAREFLDVEAGVIHFVNADLIAYGLSPLKPDLAAVQAGKLLLEEIDRLAALKTDFAFETTLSGIAHAKRLLRLKAMGYQIIIIFIRLNSTKLALRRVAARVRQGGHNVAKVDVVRRFERGLKNFEQIYRPIADSWVIYDNSKDLPRLIEGSL
jgi:predicted ABC-type ATPase